MKFDYNNIQNTDINKMIKYLIFISFVTQWSILSMIINLFTIGIIRIPLFIIVIIDALTMIKYKEKSVKRPSYILSKLWDILDYININKSTQNYNNQNYNSSIIRTLKRITKFFSNIKNKIIDLLNNIKSMEISKKKYNKERELNKFSTEIGKKITIEYTEKGKIKKKTFQYKDRAITYVKILESKGYKNYSKYNLDTRESLAYMIFNKNKDIIDLNNNSIQLKNNDPDYKFVIEGWPKSNFF